MAPRLIGAERGFGLLLVVVALAILGALTLGAFGAARHELRNATNLAFAAQAFEAAEAGLATAAAAAGAFASAPQLVRQPGPGAAGAGIRYATTVVRLNESLFLLTSVGERLDGGGGVRGRRVLGVVGRVVPGSGSAPPRFEPLRARGWIQLYQ
jgi:type II secretory pathway pseudopilin PulG